ncbi:MAG: hypothetical protein NVS4B11_05950 [Ktedonobacteraceae bacterium]
MAVAVVQETMVLAVVQYTGLVFEVEGLDNAVFVTPIALLVWQAQSPLFDCSPYQEQDIPGT